jgi:menaquinone-dependent protoporphyrinogen oxidase
MTKPILIVYATREGQTELIARRVADDLLCRGFEVETRNLGHEGGSIDLNDYGAAILAASVHAGSHEREMVKFARKCRADLERLPLAFLSVTLSEAGVEKADATPQERARFTADVRKVIDRFFAESGWNPTRVKPVAGALVYSKYNPLVRFVMKGIARKVGADTDTSRDYDYTDWVALDRFVDELANEFSATEPQTGR